MIGFMGAAKYPPACSCWLLPTPAGPMPLAVLSHARHVRLRATDGRNFVGQLDWAYWRRGTTARPILEMVDGETSALLEPADVAQVERTDSPLSPETVADLVWGGVRDWRHLPVGDEHYWDLVVGSHDLLEVTVKRTRLPCQPGTDGDDR